MPDVCSVCLLPDTYSHVIYCVPGSVLFASTKILSLFYLFIYSYAEPVCFTLANIPASFRIGKYVYIHFKCQEIHAIDFLVSRYSKEGCDLHR